ncbi:MAG: class I SAM-dependent methyltransferase [Xanthobacteraceae bacterium]
MTLPRRLESELLDHLPADDPRAMRARGDLKRVNVWMGNARRMASMLQKYAAGRTPRAIVDLGSGDGAFMLAVARRLAPAWQNVKIILLDRQNIVDAATREGFAALGWQAEAVSADAFAFLADGCDADVVTANLFLHHLTDQQLAGLFAAAAKNAWLLAACEPRRAKFVIESSRMMWVFGCNEVTVHDAVASARAGFAGNELSALWPNRTGWELHESATGFSHCFAARIPAPGGR